jgi:hypothetical protein
MFVIFGRARATPRRHAAPAQGSRAQFFVAVGMAATLVASAPAGAAVGDAVTVDGPKVVPAQFDGDLRFLPSLPSGAEGPVIYRPRLKGPPSTKPAGAAPAAPSAPTGPQAPMPSPIQNFPGMSFTDPCLGGQCGGGWPPDTNGQVGPNHYIQAVNVGYAIYNKTGTLLTAFRENQLWATAGAPPCTGNSQGDPIVVYDAIADRWILTHFAFATSGGNPIQPFYQCIAVSKTSDPVAGGWWLYPLRIDTGLGGQPPVGSLNDYPKFGVWHDCLYMGANQFGFLGGVYTGYQGVSFASFSRADLYNGNPLTWALGYIAGFSNFSMFPAHSSGRGPTAVQPGTPAWFAMESASIYEFEVRKFTPGANCGGGGVLSAPAHVPQTPYLYLSGNIVPQPNTTNKLDMIDDRIMQKVQYRKVGGVESLWVTHPVGTGVGNQVAMQWAQINVTGGTVTATPIQQGIHSPDTSLYRFMGSLAVDNQGNMALGYTTSNGSVPNFPSLAYAGRLVGDPLNTLPQTEVVMVPGAGSQTNLCGGAPCDRWGDYSEMSVDPVDDCTFWYTNEYYSSQANGTAGNWQTRIGSFKFPGCTAPAGLVQRTFVASYGNDGDPCSLTQPCRQLNAAIAAAASGGEVVVLDSAGYGAATITKPITIVAMAGVYAGVSVFSGTGITVNPVLGKVTLRGLYINGLGGTTGIDFQSGDALYLDNVVVSNFPTVALRAIAAATGAVNIHDSKFRSNGVGANFGTVGGTTAVLKVTANNTQFDGNTVGVSFTNSTAQGEFRNSTISGGTTGALLQPTQAGAVSRVSFIESTITKNSGAGISAGGGAGTASVDLSSSLVSGNGTGINAGANANVFVTDSAITRNSTGLATSGGTITSGTLNRLYNNTANGAFGGTTPRQ